MRARKWKIVLVITLLMALTCSGFAANAQEKAGAQPGWMVLSLTGNPSEMALTWQDVTDNSPEWVRYGEDAALAAATEQNATKNYTQKDQNAAYYEAVMTGLIPGQTYYYQVGNDSSKSSIKRFQTENKSPNTLKFMYLGDAQYDAQSSTMEADYTQWESLIKDAYAKNPDLDFGLLGGDMVNNGQSILEWDSFLGHGTDVFAKIPMLAAAGNHESNDVGSGKPKMMLNVLSLPQNGPEGFAEEFYSFDYGDCHITVLNSNVYLGEQGLNADQFNLLKEWIKKDITDSTATWHIVVMHHPAYPVVADNTAQLVQENWAPIFEETGVDVVFCGHQQVYMRTYPLLQGKVDEENGVTYVMATSGSKYYSAQEVSYADKIQGNTSTYQIVEISGNSFKLTSYDKTGTAIDSWSTTARVTGGSADVNNDGMVDQKDVKAILDAVLSADQSNQRLDVNGDGKIDITDAHVVLLAGKNH